MIDNDDEIDDGYYEGKDNDKDIVVWLTKIFFSEVYLKYLWEWINVRQYRDTAGALSSIAYLPFIFFSALQWENCRDFWKAVWKVTSFDLLWWKKAKYPLQWRELD